MAFIARMFTPSKSDQQSGEQYNAAYNAQQQALPRTPTPEDAAGIAATEMERKRRMRLLAGGQTILAGNAKPTLEGGTGGAKTLLGS